MFLRSDAVRGPLQPHYDGPYKVLTRGEKTFSISENNRNVTVSVDRLKPAFVVPEELEEKTTESRDVLIQLKHTNVHNNNDEPSRD